MGKQFWPHQSKDCDSDHWGDAMHDIYTRPDPDDFDCDRRIDVYLARRIASKQVPK